MPGLQKTLLLLVLCPSILFAQGGAADSILSVTVTRSERLAPDRATAFIGVEGTAETAMEAVVRAQSTMQAVLAALAKAGGRPLVGPPLPISIVDNPALRGYPAAQLPPSRVARAVVRVQVNRPEELAQLIAAAIDAGAKGSLSMAFESSATDSVRRLLLREAVAAGQQEAAALASALGGRLGAMVGTSTTGIPSFVQPTMVSFDGSFSSSNGSPDVVVSVTLSLRYRLLR